MTELPKISTEFPLLIFGNTVIFLSNLVGTCGEQPAPKGTAKEKL
jgi:hypothetical protein